MDIGIQEERHADMQRLRVVELQRQRERNSQSLNRERE
jgi:hypothetical protein